MTDPGLQEQGAAMHEEEQRLEDEAVLPAGYREHTDHI